MDVWMCYGQLGGGSFCNPLAICGGDWGDDLEGMEGRKEKGGRDLDRERTLVMIN
jgi:hypothetical protein